MSADGKSRAILVRSRPYSETSLIVHWLTQEVGLIATLAKGARRPKSPFRGKLDLFFEADISFRYSRSSTIHLLTETVTIETCPAVRSSMHALGLAAYATQLLEYNLETDTEAAWAFSLMKELLSTLTINPDGRHLLAVLEWKFLQAMGAAPAVELMHLGQEASSFLHFYEAATLADLPPSDVAPHHIREAAVQLFRLAEAAGLRLPKSRGRLMARN